MMHEARVKKVLWQTVSIIVCSLTLSFFFPTDTSYAAEGTALSDSSADIVQVKTTYTYDEMMEDISELTQMYPSVVSACSIGTTALGRSIPCVTVGNPDAPYRIMVQASIHAREYICTQVVMNMIETYAQRFVTGQNADMYSKVAFDVVPMANPDGVSIVQFGAASAANSPDTADFIEATGNISSWKANAMGVDLNRNFDIGWEAINQGVYAPSYALYKGVSSCSEAETVALETQAQSYPYAAYISYHMKGNIIYYDEPGNTAQNSALGTSVAKAIASASGYKMKNLKSCISATGDVVQGGFTDWIQLVLNRPAVTVEIGSSLPPAAQPSADDIYNSNLNTWAAISDLY
jgi:g-D-glutamyl-meso-diaminopimelate peptidase